MIKHTGNEYKCDMKIGHGSNGTVFKSTDKDGSECAIKIINCDSNIGISSMVLYELMMMKKMKWIGMYQIKDYFVSYDESLQINIVSDYYPNNLLNYVIENDIDTIKANKIFVRLLHSISYLESIGYYHGDLSSNNVMLNFDLTPVIIDFASSRKFRRLPVNLPTIDIRPIEMLTLSCIEPSKIDIWSLGCLFYMMLSRDAIADGISEEECAKSIKEIFGLNSLSTASKVNYSFIGIEYRDIIKKMLNIDPHQRISIEQLQNNSFIQQMNTTYNFYKHKRDAYFQKLDYGTNIICINDRGRMIDFMINLKMIFNVTFEAVHISIHLVDKVHKKIYMDIISLSLMAFSISCKIISDLDISVNDINKILLNFDKDPINMKIYTHVILDICEKSAWDIDPMNIYDHIHSLNDTYENSMNMLLMMTAVVPDIIKYDILTRIIALYIIIKHNNNDFVKDDFLRNIQSNIHGNTNLPFTINCVKTILSKFFMKCIRSGNSDIKKYMEYSKKYFIIFDDILKNIDCNGIMDSAVVYLC